MCLGGRTAEELVFEEPTTGAENDIEKVTRIARAMVTEYGMSDALGPQQLGQRDGEVFLGREFGHQANYSEEVAAAIDREVRGLIDEAHDRARAILAHHRDTLDQLARELVEKETLDSYELAGILGSLAPWAGEERSDGRCVPAGQDLKDDRRGRGNGAGSPVAADPDMATPPPARPRRTRPTATPAPVGATPRSTTTGSGARKSRSVKAKAAAGEEAPAGPPGRALDVPAAKPIAPARRPRARDRSEPRRPPPVRRPRPRPKPTEP